MTAEQGAFPQPVFVGGMARSGTTAMGRLVASHPRYQRIPVEARFHAEREGIPHLLEGRVGIDRFVEKVRGLWWRRGLNMSRGLHVALSEEERDAALADFQAAYDRDPDGAARTLIHALLDPSARRAGKPSWVEVTGKNVASGVTLIRLLPRAKIIHMIRDGRDVAASLRNKEWGRDDVEKALRIWESRLRAGEEVARALPPGALLVMRMEDLVVRDREASLQRLLDHLEIDDEAPIREYFDAEIRGDAANLGRWRSTLDGEDQARLDRLYGQLLEDLERDGVSCAPPPAEAEAPSPPV